MSTVKSNDGTQIAYSTAGNGPPVILVDGALCYRKFGPAAKLAAVLSQQFTVFSYDRRGRGGSGDTPPYDAQREIEDLQALIARAGGSACLYGVSSGAALALEAAARGGSVNKLVLYELPFTEDPGRAAASREYTAQLSRRLCAGQRSQAVKLFLHRVGVPAPVITLMRFLPVWPKLTTIAHTLAYDDAIMSIATPGQPLPAQRWAAVTIPTLCLAGANSPSWLHDGLRALAAALPSGQYRALQGQNHVVKPKVHEPVLKGFFTSHGRAEDVPHGAGQGAG